MYRIMFFRFIYNLLSGHMFYKFCNDIYFFMLNSSGKKFGIFLLRKGPIKQGFCCHRVCAYITSVRRREEVGYKGFKTFYNFVKGGGTGVSEISVYPFYFIEPKQLNI